MERRQSHFNQATRKRDIASNRTAASLQMNNAIYPMEDKAELSYIFYKALNLFEH